MTKVFAVVRARPGWVVAALLLGLAASCSSGGSDNAQATSSSDVDTTATTAAPTPDEPVDFGQAPDVPTGASDQAATEALEVIVETIGSEALRAADPAHAEELDAIVATGDARFAWALSDILRFSQGARLGTGTVDAMEQLTGTTFDPLSPWGDSVNHLIAWDLPAHEGYADWKARLLGAFDPRWVPLFEGGDAIDHRYVSWGGVLIDDRPLGVLVGCQRCIPALDDPVVTDAAGGGWYADDAIVFGVVIDGEARAYPKNIMQVHEMVNDTLGGRRIAIPYCTLCGSAQAYLTDELGPDFEAPVMRTSGLLIRSNKMMYELHTGSFVDTFVGEATSGELAAAGVTFNQVSVVASAWGDWKAAHPDTTIVAEDGGIGRTYTDDPLNGRDDEGPIFPIGDVDARLGVQEPVVGIVTEDGPLAFHAAAARAALIDGEPVRFGGVELQLEGSGFRAFSTPSDGASADDAAAEVPSHEAFWFAWSQFHPDTELWPLDAS